MTMPLMNLPDAHGGIPGRGHVRYPAPLDGRNTLSQRPTVSHKRRFGRRLPDVWFLARLLEFRDRQPLKPHAGQTHKRPDHRSCDPPTERVRQREAKRPDKKVKCDGGEHWEKENWRRHANVCAISVASFGICCFHASYYRWIPSGNASPPAVMRTKWQRA